jgi:hypothetical protein
MRLLVESTKDFRGQSERCGCMFTPRFNDADYDPGLKLGLTIDTSTVPGSLCYIGVFLTCC